MELTVFLPDYTAPHPKVTFAFVVTVCHREMCGVYSFYLPGGKSHISYPPAQTKYKMAGIFSNITRFAKRFG